jgi:hypothetical protein
VPSAVPTSTPMQVPTPPPMAASSYLSGGVDGSCPSGQFACKRMNARLWLALRSTTV